MRFIAVSSLAITLCGTPALCPADWLKIRFDGAVADIFLNTEDGRLYLDDRETPLLEFEQTRSAPTFTAAKRKSPSDAGITENPIQTYEFSGARTLDSSAPEQVKNRNRLLTIRIENGVAYQIIHSPSGSSVNTGSAEVIERSEIPAKESESGGSAIGSPVSGQR